MELGNSPCFPEYPMSPWAEQFFPLAFEELFGPKELVCFFYFLTINVLGTLL